MLLHTPIASICILTKSFCVNGRRYRLSRADTESLDLFLQLEQSRRVCPDGRWGVRHRSMIQRLIALDSKMLFNAAIQSAADEETTRLAIWLRGLMGGYSGTPHVVVALRSSKDTATRKTCVRALRRMNGYHQLRQLSINDHDPQIRQLAACQLAKSGRRRSLQDRLRGYSHLVRRQEITQAPQTLRINDSVNWSDKFQPKSPHLIRRILNKIRTLVRYSQPMR